MIWEPVDFENSLTSLGKGSSFFLQRIPDKHLLFIHEGEITSLLVLQLVGTRLVVDNVKTILSTNTVFRITGNNNCILMIDDNEELFYLVGTIGGYTDVFNENNGRKFLTSDGALSWQRLHQLTNCLAMTGITNAVFFLYHNISVYASHYGTHEIKNGLCEISKRRLNDFDDKMKYYVKTLKDEMANIVCERVVRRLIPAKEVMLVIEPLQMYFIIPTPEGQIQSQPYSTDFQEETIINVLSFKKTKLIVIICKSGKIMSLNFSNSCKTFQSGHAWLLKPVSAIDGYEGDNIYLFWSDLNNLYLSSLDEDNAIRNLQVSQNIRGVRHITLIDENIILITVYGCLYETNINSTPDTESKCSSHVLLNKMFQIGKETEKLTKEVAVKEDFMKALHISRISKISNNICSMVKEDTIHLENKTEYLFQKELWRIVIEKEDYGRKQSEAKTLEYDLAPGGTTSFKYSGKIPNRITLVCDIKDDVITIDVRVQNEREKPENDDQLFGIRQFLKEKCNFIA